MKIYKRVISLVIALTLIIGMVPMSTITAHAIGEVLRGTYYAEAGETTTVTCLGGAIWAQTHFSISGFGIGKVTKYDSDGTVEYEQDIFGSYSGGKTGCLAGEQYVFDMYYGSIEIFFTTSNVGYPRIEKVPNNSSLVPPVKLNENPLYLTLGETQELFIEWTQPLYDSKVISYSSNNKKVATVTEEGLVTGNCEGEAIITVDYSFARSDGKALSLSVECPVTVVDDVVNKNTGFRFYYSDEEIEPGDIVQIGAGYSFGDITGMYHPGTVEWKVSNEDVLKIIQTVDNVTMVRVEALAMGQCDLSLILDGKVMCTETIDVTITDDTLISMYKDYLMDCAVMTTLGEARNTCWDVIGRYSSGNKARIAFMTCLKSDLGLSVITKEAAAAVGLTSSTHEDTVDEAIDLLMAEIFSSEEAIFSEGLSTFKKRFKAYGAFTKTTSFTGGSVASALSQVTSFSESQIKSVEGLAMGFVGDGISMAELVSGAVMTVQYERDVVVSLMNTVASAPGGTNSDLYKGLERLLFEMDNLELYVAARYLNNKMVDGLKDIIKDGLFSKDAKIFNKTIWNVASGMGYLISRAYALEGGVFADDYMKACITSGFAGTLCNVVKNSNSAMELEYGFKFYVASVKVALDAAIGLCGDTAVNCLDLKYIAEGCLNQIDATCSYENLLEQCRRAVVNASDIKSNVYIENGEIVVDAYWQLPKKKVLMFANNNTGDFDTTGYTSDQIITVPSHINGEKVNGIAADGFRGITNKYGVVLPNSVIRIGDNAFSDCPQVTFVVLGDNLKEIGKYAFNNNSSLQVVNLPESLEIIKEGAFNNCTSLTSVTIKNKKAVIAEDAFDNCNKNLKIYGYKNTDAEKIAIANGYTFVELSETVSSVDIVTSATKTEYEMGETINTDGMTLKVTYMDGTSEVVRDGWIAYADTTVVGEVAVKVYYGEKLVTYSVMVTEVEASAVELEDTNVTMLFGSSKQLSACILPNTCKNVQIVWETSDSNVATVDANGYVEAIGTGTAVITAKILNSDISTNCDIIVVDTKEINPSVSKTDYISFTARENGYYVFYSVDGKTGATGSILDINGNTLYSNGGTNFRVEGQLHKDKTYILETSSNSNNGVFKVVINKSVLAERVLIKDYQFNDISEISGYPGDSKTLYVDYAPINYISETCTWESADTSIATVDAKGVVSFVAPGTTAITVTSENGLTNTCTVVVKQFTDCEEIKNDEFKTVTLTEGERQQYFKFTPEESGWYVFYTDKWVRSGTLLNTEGEYINGSSSYSSPIRVEHEFVSGETYIFKVGYVKDYDAITEPFNLYLKKLTPAQSISIDQGNSLIRYPYASVWLTYSFEPTTDIIPETCVWTSSNTEVATVNDSGYVYTKKAGTTTITVTSSNGLSDQCEIIVEDYPDILCGEQKKVIISDAHNIARYRFTPQETGWYALYSISDQDTFCYLIDENENELAYDSSSGDGENFRIEYKLQQGETYFYIPKFNYSLQIGNFDIKLEKMNPAETINIDNGEQVVGYVGHMVNLSATFAPQGCIKEEITWNSSDTDVATVDNNGRVQLLTVGEAEITVVSENGLSDSCTVVVTDYPTINVGETKTVEIKTGGEYSYFQFIPERDGEYVFNALSTDFTCAYLDDSQGNRIDYDSTSGDGSAFRIQANLVAGETYVLRCKYYSSSKTGTFDIRLIELVDADSVQIINGDTLTDCIGTYHTLTAELLPENAREETLSWSSSDDTVVSVDAHGNIELLAIGTATITVTSEKGLADSILVTVTDYPELQLDETKTIEITEENRDRYFKFTPTQNGTYIFAIDSDMHTEIFIVTEDGTSVGSNWGYKFNSTYKLTANTTYHISTSLYHGSDIGTYTLKVTKAPEATSMRITAGETVNAFVGERQNLYVTFEPSGSVYESVTWASDNTSVVTVDVNGSINIVGAGSATITATSENGLTATCLVKAREVLSIVYDEEKVLTTEVDSGIGMFSFTPTTDGTYAFFSYNNSFDTYGYILDSNMSTLASDDDSGDGSNFKVVYTMTAGRTYYLKSRPYSNSSTGSYSVKVIQLVPATSFEITNGDSISGLVNNGCNLNTKFGPENAIIENITWTSSNTDVATVSSYGYVNFVSTGTATITATTANGLTDSIEVTVNDRPKASVMEIVNGDRITGYVGAAKNLQVRFQPDGCVYESVTWSSDNTEVATVNTNGVVTFLAEGVATITATSENGLTDTCVITVEDCETLTMEQPVKVTITNNGEEYVRFSPSEGGLLRVYISELSNSNDPDIWLYDSSMNTLTWTYDEFLDYEFEAGETYYIATNYHSWSGSGEGTYYLNVVKPVPATSISFDIGSEYSDYVGTSRYINVIYAPNHAITESITWSSSDSSIVSVNRYGQITLNAIGTATITAISENGLVFNCVITVEDFETIEVGQEKTVVLDGDEAYYYFTPDEDGYYSFYSYDNDHDTYGYLLNSDMEELKSDDDGGDGNNFKVQYRLEAGVTYILKARFWNTDNRGSFKVCVEQTKYITALEIVSMPEKTEYIKNYVSGDNISYYGLKLKATWSDGTTTDWKYNFDWYIDGEYISRDAFDVQETGNVKLTCGDASVTLTFTLIDNPVDHLELVSGSSYSYVENYNGYVSANSNGEYFYYYPNIPSDAVINIVYKDGTSTTSKVGEYIDGYRIDWSENQYQEPWVVGTDNKSMISYLGHTVNLPITVKENKVASIEVVSGRVTCIENTNGYQGDNGYVYWYSVPSDVMVKISYTDGTEKIVGIYDEVDGYRLSFDDDQYDEPWTMGDDNYLIVSYLGVETHLPVSISVNPVERIEINTAPTREYVYGDVEYGYLYSDGDYEFHPTDLTGLTFTVYYTDGTSKTFTYDDIDEEDNINGYGYALHYDAYNPEIGNFPVQFEYMGKTAEYSVVLKESAVAKIEVTKQPNKTSYADNYAPDFVGMEFTITYTDGTTKAVVLSEDNLKYEYDPWWGELRYKVDVDGNQFIITPYYGGDVYCYIAYYQGASCLIEDITSTESKEVSSIELDKVTWNGDGMNVKITYTDETSETLILDIADFYDFEGSSGAGFGKTKNGLLYYYIETYTDEDGNVEKYKVSILNRDITVEPSSVLIGDVNGDGVVDNIDRLTLSRYLADWEGYTADVLNMAAADVNQDSVVDNLDRMVLSRHLADWEGYEKLPCTTE